LWAPCGASPVFRDAWWRGPRPRRASPLITGGGMTGGLRYWSVASARSMRQQQAGPALSCDQNGRRRHAVRDGHEPGNQLRLARAVREGIEVSSDRIAGSKFRGDGGPGCVAVAVDEAKIRTASQQAVRLGPKKLRPSGADPPRRRPETVAAKDVGDGRGRHAHPDPEQFSLNAHVPPAGVLPPATNDQAGGFWREAGDARGDDLAAVSAEAPGASGEASTGSPRSMTIAPAAADDSPPPRTPGRRSCTAAASRVGSESQAGGGAPGSRDRARRRPGRPSRPASTEPGTARTPPRRTV
jgi:hypothetical protein